MIWLFFKEAQLLGYLALGSTDPSQAKHSSASSFPLSRSLCLSVCLSVCLSLSRERTARAFVVSFFCFCGRSCLKEIKTKLAESNPNTLHYVCHTYHYCSSKSPTGTAAYSRGWTNIYVLLYAADTYVEWKVPSTLHLLGGVEGRVEGGALAGHVLPGSLVHLRHGHRLRRPAREKKKKKRDQSVSVASASEHENLFLDKQVWLQRALFIRIGLFGLHALSCGSLITHTERKW